MQVNLSDSPDMRPIEVFMCSVVRRMGTPSFIPTLRECSLSFSCTNIFCRSQDTHGKTLTIWCTFLSIVILKVRVEQH